MTTQQRTGFRLTLLLGAILTLVAACGGTESSSDSPTASATATTSATAGATTATTEAMDDMDDDGHEHADDAEAREWDAPVPPQISVEVLEDGGRFTAALSVTGFEFTTPTDLDHVPGVGHTHLYLDGQLLGMFYEPDVALGELAPGTHHIEVTLSAADHVDYAIDGEIISTSTMVDVAGSEPAPDVDIAIGFAGGEVTAPDNRIDIPVDSLVHMTITSDVADEVHLHGYDIVMDLEAGVPITLKFVADVQGIFELELEDSRVPLVELKVQ